MPRVLSWDEYATVWAGLHGGTDPRRARPSVVYWLRLGYTCAKVGARLRVPPGGVTALGIVACLFVPVTAVRGVGGTLVAALLVVVGAIADTVDGALAVLTDRTTRLGYVYDSVADRIGEMCWLAGFYLLGVSGPVVVAVGALSWLHEYARSRANAAGMTEISALTVGERPTRVVLSFLGFALAVVPGVAGACVGVWGVLSLIGFGQLAMAVHRALAGRPWPSWRRDGAPLAEAVARRVVRPEHAEANRPTPDLDTPEYVSTGHISAGPVSAGHVSAGYVPAGHVSADLASAGPVSAGHVSTDLASAGPVSAGYVSAGYVPSLDAADPIAELEFDVDPALRVELAALDELPHGTSIYISAAAAAHTGRHTRETDDKTEPTPIPALASPGRHQRADDAEPEAGGPDNVEGMFPG